MSLYDDHSSSMKSEAEKWIIECLRGNVPQWPLSDASTEKIWNLADQHGVIALCSHNLNANPSARDSLPHECLEQFQNYTRMAAVRELKEQADLSTVLKKFSEQGFEYLLTKGTPLAYLFYPEPYLRTRFDTDLIFSDREQADRAWGVLAELGYTRRNAISGDLISYEFACYNTGASGLETCLDVHWKLNNSQYLASIFSFDELADESIAIPHLGEYARSPCLEHMLLHACLHRFAHVKDGEANRLIWLYDIYLMASTLEQDQWNRFLKWAIEKKICNICKDGLTQTESLFPASIPPSVLMTLQEKGANEDVSMATASSAWKMAMLDFKTLPNWNSRLLLLKEHLLPSAAYILRKYDSHNRALLPYFYLKRILQGIGKRF